MADMALAFLGGVIVCASAFALYLASPNAKLLNGGVPMRIALAAGLTGTVVGLGLILCWAGSATAVFIAWTLAMTVLSIVPLAVAWWRGPPERRK